MSSRLRTSGYRTASSVGKSNARVSVKNDSQVVDYRPAERAVQFVKQKLAAAISDPQLSMHH